MDLFDDKDEKQLTFEEIISEQLRLDQKQKEEKYHSLNESDKALSREQMVIEEFYEFLQKNSLENLGLYETKAVRKIVYGDAYHSLYDADSEINMLNHLRVLIQQNWIIINQLSRLIQKINKKR